MQVQEVKQRIVRNSQYVGMPVEEEHVEMPTQAPTPAPRQSVQERIRVCSPSLCLTLCIYGMQTYVLMHRHMHAYTLECYAWHTHANTHITHTHTLSKFNANWSISDNRGKPVNLCSLCKIVVITLHIYNICCAIFKRASVSYCHDWLCRCSGTRTISTDYVDVLVQGPFQLIM